MNSEDAIVKVLDEQIDGYKKLLGILQKERFLLIDFDTDGIEELYKEKDVLILRLRLLEEERQRLIKYYDCNITTLKELSEKTGNSTFLDRRSILKSLLQSIGELNSFNRLLIERSIGHIRATAGFFNTFGINQPSSAKGMLLSREM